MWCLKCWNLILVIFSSNQWLICCFRIEEKQLVWTISRKLKLGLQTNFSPPSPSLVWQTLLAYGNIFIFKLVLDEFHVLYEKSYKGNNNSAACVFFWKTNIQQINLFYGKNHIFMQLIQQIYKRAVVRRPSSVVRRPSSSSVVVQNEGWVNIFKAMTCSILLHHGP